MDTKKQELIEKLEDLKHDLGKYLVLPVAMLPWQADDASLKKAIEDGVFRTRKKAEHCQSAEEIWNLYKTSLEQAKQYSGFTQLIEAVDCALALPGQKNINRENALFVLGRVSNIISDLIQEIQIEG